MSLDIFEHHHRIISQHSKSQNDSGVNYNIQFATAKPDNCEGAEKHHGNRKAGSNNGPEIPQEKEHNYQRKDDGIAQSTQHVFVGEFNQITLCIRYLKTNIRIFLFQLFHLRTRHITH